MKFLVNVIEPLGRKFSNLARSANLPEGLYIIIYGKNCISVHMTKQSISTSAKAPKIYWLP